MARAESAARSVVFSMMLAFTLLFSVTAALTAIVGPINQLTQTDATTTIELTETARDEAIAAVSGVPEGSWLQFAEDGYPIELHVPGLEWSLRLLTQLGPSLLFACLAVAALLFYQALRQIRAGNPFHRSNARRFRIIALLLVIGGVGGQMLEGFARASLLNVTGAAQGAGPAQMSFSLSLNWILAGAACLILAEAFARGRDLADDTEGLV
jgi:hypothetical protein